MKLETKIAILGGGVTGLCAAHYLAREFGTENILLLEASDYLGGTTRTESIDGFLCDWGPNGFLNREPLTLQWIEDLGIASSLVTADESSARRFIMKNGQLMEILPPPRFLFTPLLSLAGRARLVCEPLISSKKDDSPETIWDFAARRIGREAADTLVGPMVSGVFGGDAHQLSLAHCFPRMAAMERDYGSLLKALIAKRKENSSASAMGPSGVLTSFQKAIGFLPEVAGLQLAGRALTGKTVHSVTRPNGTFRVQTDDDTRIEAEAVVVAVPAYHAATMVADLDPAASHALGRIAYADIAVVCTAYPREMVDHDLNGFGYLVPRTQGLRTLGCLWTSSIFPNQAPKGHVLLRSMLGGYTDPEAVRLSDRQLLDQIRKDVHPILGIGHDPTLIRVYRHFRGIPQYLLHHGECLAATDAAESTCPGLVFAGNAYRGVGLNDCVLSAHRAIGRVRAILGPA